jgi:5-amino-6-(5-phosphoribosylamino)uracil reductase
MRPKIISHMVASIDGRLRYQRWSKPASGIDPDTLDDHYEETANRFKADGWMVGRQTAQNMSEGKPRKVKLMSGDLRGTHVADRKGRPLAVTVDPHGKVHYGADNIEGDHVIAILGEQVSDEYLSELREDGVSYLFAGRDGQDMAAALEILSKTFAIKTLLLEGGGKINGTFLKAGLIDEISVLIYPGIDGLAGVPSIFEYVGKPDEKPADGQSLRHLATETLEGGMVWIRYVVERNAAKSS